MTILSKFATFFTSATAKPSESSPQLTVSEPAPGETPAEVVEQAEVNTPQAEGLHIVGVGSQQCVTSAAEPVEDETWDEPPACTARRGCDRKRQRGSKDRSQFLREARRLKTSGCYGAA
ncbi:MAG: hypothetical protein C0469_00115 [Cyanobacteria bacterium DS2.3.42]|nr:hypothetical protein [Cyanobacteria bacterium DS2.3.42]